MKRLVMLVLVAMMALGILTACGSSSSGATKEIEVIMGANGEWRFNPDKIEVNKGDNVKVTLVNKDTSTEHTFLIPKLNVKSKKVAAGQTDSVTFKADKEGEYDIHCDVTGHKDGGMVGKLIVK